MPFKCCVPKCRGNYAGGPKVSTFAFPKDLDIKKKWLKAVSRQDFIPNTNSRVCELHFNDTDIERCTKVYSEDTGQLLELPLKCPRLVKGAIPSTKLPDCAEYLSKAVTDRESPEAKKLKMENDCFQKAIAESKTIKEEMDPNFFHTYATLQTSGFSSGNITNIQGNYSSEQQEEEFKPLDTDDANLEVHQICRSCLTIAEVNNLEDIFIDGINSVVIYENISQIKVESENMPAVICLNCTLELEKVYRFIKMLKYSYKVLAKATEEINQLDEQDINMYNVKKTSILRHALEAKFRENFEASEDHQQDFDTRSEHSAEDKISVHNNDWSSSDEIHPSEQDKIDVQEKQPDTAKKTEKKSIDNNISTKNVESNDNLEILPDNNSFQTKKMSSCPVCCKKIRNYEKHLQSAHKLDWNNSKCLKCPYQNDDKEKLLKHSTECIKPQQKNKKLEVDVLSEMSSIASDDSDPEFEAFLKELNLDELKAKIKPTDKIWKRKKFACVKCPNAKFGLYKEIETHLKTVHKDEYECIICEEEFNNSFCLLHHMMKKHGKMKCCRMCLVSFNTWEELKVHYKSKEHNTKCTVCGQQFNTKRALYRHRRSKHLNPHLLNKKYKCAECPKEFANTGNLRRHKLIAHNDVRYLCDICGQVYTTRMNLRFHEQKIHEGIEIHRKQTKKNFFCEICGKELKLYNKYFIAKHRAKHKGYNFVCRICYDSFLTEEDFKKHVEDSGHRVFQCDRCPAQFVKQENYKVHLKDHDVPGWKRSRSTTTSGTLTKLRNERGVFQCHYCVKIFKTGQGLDNHIRVHTNERPFKCHVCSKGFKTTIHLKTHLNIHLGIKKYVCNFCGKAFTNSSTLRGHEKIHTGERPHRCPECNKGFISTSGLKKHRPVHFKTTGSSYGKKDKPNVKEEDKTDSEHEENAEFKNEYEQMFAESEESYESY